MKNANIVFVEKARKIHANKYDYSLVQYVNAKTKVNIICTIHGIFSQTPDGHLQKRGCLKCSGKEMYSIEKLILKFNKVHKNAFEYNIQEYNGIFSKITAKCNFHGSFEQTAHSHMSGNGCPKCSGKGFSREEIINTLTGVHNGIYDYSNSVFKTVKDRIEISCKAHGSFFQILEKHKTGSGCPKCKKSKGEKIIRAFLISKNLEFDEQKSFYGCINKNTKKFLLFDFYIPKYNLCIEYDGEQHFKPMRFSRNNTLELKNIKFRDNIKNNFCKNSNIDLMRISYIDINKIDELLTAKLFN